MKIRKVVGWGLAVLGVAGLIIYMVSDAGIVITLEAVGLTALIIGYISITIYLIISDE